MTRINGKQFDIDMRPPTYPLRYEKEVDEKYAHLIDGDGFLWTKENVNGEYKANCLRYGITQIICSDSADEYDSVKVHLGEHLYPMKEAAYEGDKKWSGDWKNWKEWESTDG